MVFSIAPFSQEVEPPEIPGRFNLLLQFGATEKSGDGTTRHYFDKPARRRLRSYAGPLASLLEAHLDCYAVVGAEGTIVTAAHRNTRIKH
ncbi:hypothetical protein [Paraburkholderia sp. 40]|uniref:hypothetical protein n=1 Tax=Paraburkholderia sp. 40 TaxID=2991059 RepID=UPI003D25F3CB